MYAGMFEALNMCDPFVLIYSFMKYFNYPRDTEASTEAESFVQGHPVRKGGSGFVSPGSLTLGSVCLTAAPPCFAPL